MHSGLPDGISLRDPRPVVKEAPYTFFVPPAEHLAELRPGDLIKAIFSDRDGGHAAERMWVTIERVLDDHFVGTLDNEPDDMQNLEEGDPVTVHKTHVIALLTGDNRDLPDVDRPREYWQRCMVDQCVLDGRSLVDYLYRELPDLTQDGDDEPDSGWRLRGTDEGIAEDEAADQGPQYVALGAVLNRDDRWLPLIDEPAGNAWHWNEEQRSFLHFDRPDLLEGDKDEQE
ncbi:MAG: DUF2185 domain-containing protein [Erythrobacter sp.]